jgi:hypothetical protein
MTNSPHQGTNNKASSIDINHFQSEGLLYHMISRGGCIGTTVYEKYCSELQAECSQNIYVH